MTKICGHYFHNKNQMSSSLEKTKTTVYLWRLNKQNWASGYFLSILLCYIVLSSLINSTIYVNCFKLYGTCVTCCIFMNKIKFVIF